MSLKESKHEDSMMAKLKENCVHLLCPYDSFYEEDDRVHVCLIRQAYMASFYEGSRNIIMMVE